MRERQLAFGGANQHHEPKEWNDNENQSCRCESAADAGLADSSVAGSDQNRQRQRSCAQEGSNEANDGGAVRSEHIVHNQVDNCSLYKDRVEEQVPPHVEWITDAVYYGRLGYAYAEKSKNTANGTERERGFGREWQLLQIVHLVAELRLDRGLRFMSNWRHATTSFLEGAGNTLNFIALMQAQSMVSNGAGSNPLAYLWWYQAVYFVVLAMNFRSPSPAYYWLVLATNAVALSYLPTDLHVAITGIRMTPKIAFTLSMKTAGLLILLICRIYRLMTLTAPSAH